MNQSYQKNFPRHYLHWHFKVTDLLNLLLCLVAKLRGGSWFFRGRFQPTWLSFQTALLGDGTVILTTSILFDSMKVTVLLLSLLSVKVTAGGTNQGCQHWVTKKCQSKRKNMPKNAKCQWKMPNNMPKKY